METIPDFQDDDDGGLSDCEAFRYYYELWQQLLAADPKYSDWLDYIQEQNSHVH